MPPKGRKRAALPDLSPDQLDTARNLYLRRGATPTWVAEQLGVSWRSVESAARSLGWTLERAEREELRRRRAKPDAIAQVALEAEQDERHAALARRELELREALVEKAQAALVDMSPDQALKALGRFSGLKDLQFVERLARNRNTDKTDQGEDEVDEFCHVWMEAIAKGLGVAAPGGPASDPEVVEPTGRA